MDDILQGGLRGPDGQDVRELPMEGLLDYYSTSAAEVAQYDEMILDKIRSIGNADDAFKGIAFPRKARK